MADKPNLSSVIEIVTALAVVVSLVYVGQEIRQNTAAIHATTGQAAYEMHQARIGLYMENPALAELEVRARTDASSLSPADSVQWRYDLNFRLNLYEMVHANLEAGTIATDMAESWLALLGPWTCLPLAEHFWSESRDSYTDSFGSRVDSAMADPSRC